MVVRRAGYVFLISVVVSFIMVSYLAVSKVHLQSFELIVQLLALNGFLALSIATLLTPFLKEIRTALGKPFAKVHHAFAAVGLTLITLHPIAFFIQTPDSGLFLPNLQSLYLFLYWGGRQALIIIYVALAAVFLWRKIPRYWRLVHAFMYVALFFAVVHANFIGVDFQNLFIRIIFDSLFAASIAAFGFKRLRNYRVKEAALLKTRQNPPK
jgi:sulfoxide reductase heme-binding subunit YedZ